VSPSGRWRAPAPHEVIAYVRDPAKPAPRERLAVVAGDIRDADALTEAMCGTDAVISTLRLDSPVPNNLSADSTRAIVHAAERSGTPPGPDHVGVRGRRLAGESVHDRAAHWSTGGKAIYADGPPVNASSPPSDLDWTLAYPVRLTNKPASGTARAIDLADLTLQPGLPESPAPTSRHSSSAPP
jgi:NAD(P)H-binding